MEVFELKSTITNVKNSIDWLNCRVEGTEERTSGPENRTVEITRYKKRENRLGKK